MRTFLRHGAQSRYAPLLDIDWSKGPLHFAVLDGTPAELLENGQIALMGDALRIYDQRYLLRAPFHDQLTRETLDCLLADQHWRIGHWRDSADAIVHRRFFNISSLIGVRQEDPEVFDFTHRWIVAQVRAGRIQGLRVDHVDGLARPGAYLRRLREAIGVVPIWVEKIVKQGETIPASWPVEGMSGYEIMAPITQLLTEPDGLRKLQQPAVGVVPRDSEAEVRAVRMELLNGTFVPELDRVTRAAQAALAIDAGNGTAVRAAIAQLAVHWPVYRSYAGDALPLGPAHVAALDAAKADRTPSEALGPVFSLLAAPDDPLARAFAARFEQLTGALTAKSEEDTVFFRAVTYLPFCEVGGKPGLLPIDAEAFARLMSARASATPCALNALSTHDTKRSADARAVIIALTYLPDLSERLYRRGRTLARESAVTERWGIYAAQIALILYREADRDARAADHIAKAMRESKDSSSHEDPVLEAEVAVTAIVHRVMEELADHIVWSQTERNAFEAIHADLVLAQVALQLTAPGIPDVYQGTETLSSTLTDPDNRRAVPWEALASPERLDSLDQRKLALTRMLLARRREQPELFAMGDYALQMSEHGWTVHRQWQDQRIAVDIARPRVRTPVPV